MAFVERSKLMAGMGVVAAVLLLALACQQTGGSGGLKATATATPSPPREVPTARPDLLGGSFASWPAGSTQPPASWTLERALVTAVQATERVGPVWARVTANGSWARLQYSIPNPADYAGKTLTLSAWARAEPQNSHEQRIGIADNLGSTVSSVVSRDGQFHFVSATRKIASSPDWIEVNLFANYSATGDAQDVAYFDSVILVQGEYSSLTPRATPTVVASPGASRPIPTPVVARNLLKNEGFERWNQGPNAAPDAWTLERASVSREEVIKKVGPFAVRLESAGAWARIEYSVPEFGYYAGKTLTLMVWARAEPGNDKPQQIGFKDEGGESVSPILKKDGQFHLLSVTRRIAEGSTFIEVNLFVNYSAAEYTYDVAYFDNPVLIEGDRPPLPWALP